MSTSFVPFQVFASAEEAQPLLASLATAGIATETGLEAGQLAFDPTLASPQLFTSFVLRLLPADFERARHLQEQVNEHLLARLSPEHYLYGFSDAELRDIQARPDEWSGLDVTLARVLLQRRGQALPAAEVQALRERRTAELARPDPGHPGWLLTGYALALLGGVFGVLIGAQLYFHRKDLPDGGRRYAYSAAVRLHGLRIMLLGGVMFGLALYLQLSS